MLGFNTFAEAPFSTVRPIYFIGITGQELNVAGNPAPPEPFTAFGDAQLSTAQKQFGTASLLLDGNGDYIQSTNNIDFSSQATNFTFECWLRPNSTSGINRILQLGPDSNAESLYYQVNTFTASVGGSTVLIREVASLPTDSWTHIAYVRQGTGRVLYVNGTQVGSGTSANMPSNGKVGIGYSPSAAPTQTWDGYIDEARLSNNVRYSSNFTPSGPFTADTNTIGLFHFDGANGSTTITNSASQGINIIGNANVGVNTNIITAAVGDVTIFGNATVVATGQPFEIGTTDARSATWSKKFPNTETPTNTWERIVTP